MDATPARMGKGLFGYKAKDVQKLFADREAMLRLAQQQSQEVRARADQMQAELGRVQEEITGRDRAIEALREEVRQRDESVSALRGELSQAQSMTQGRIAELEGQTQQLHQQLQQQLQDQDAQTLALQQQLQEREAAAMHLQQVQQQLQQQLHEQAMARDSQQILMDELAPILRAAQESAQRIVERAEETGELKTREAEQMRAELSGAISQYVRWRQRLEGIMATVQDRLDDAQSRIAEVPKRIQEALAPMSDAIYLFNEDLTTLSQVGEPPGQVAIPAAPQQAAEQPAAQASGDDHIVLPDASRQQPGQGAAGQPASPAQDPTYLEPESNEPTIEPGGQPADSGPRYIEETGDAVEGDDSTGVWTRTGWS